MKRDVAREELIRKEEAARTVKEFDSITKDWDKLDSNRERKERYHETRLADQMFDWDIFSRQLYVRDTDFVTQMFLCPCQMHNLVSNEDISRLIDDATDKQKAVFFPRVIVGCSAEQIAKCHDMTERNVRKLIDLMTTNVRNEYYKILEEREKAKQYLNYEKRRFLKNYKSNTKKGKKGKKKPVDKNDNGQHNSNIT